MANILRSKVSLTHYIHRYRFGSRYRSLVTSSNELGPSFSRLSKTIREIFELDQTESGVDIVVKGWVRSVRRMKNVSFAAISDGSTLKPLQAVLTSRQAER